MSEKNAPRGEIAWRLWALVPILLLAAAVAGFVTAGSSILDLVGQNPPQVDAFDVRRVEFKPGEIRVRVTNPQHDDLTVASVAVDDAIVSFTTDGPQTLGHLRSTTVVIPFSWVRDDPISVGLTSSSGIETVEEVDAAVESPGVTGEGFLGYAIIGFLVGILPVGLGLLWLPALRRVQPHWLTAFMALTVGLLSFLGVEALFEGLERQAALPAALGGPGLVLLGLALSYLSMTVISGRVSRSKSGAGAAGPVTGVALATLVAIGIGVHNLGEGLAIGTSFAFGQLTLGSFLIVGFMIHNVTEGLGIAAPAADSGSRLSPARLVALTLIAGGPAILGTWLGGFVANDVLAVLFFGAAAGAAFEVVVEVGRYVLKRAPLGIKSPWVVGGYLSGVAVMYVTGLVAG